MTDRSQLPESLFAQLLDLLDGSSDRERIRERGEALCATHPEHAAAIRSQLDRALADDQDQLDAATATDTGGMPDWIGPYRVLAPLGEGGTGEVYKAERRAPVRQTVALKVIKQGLATKEVLARFELERRALAAMSHGSIARVFDAGATETGEPYFVMELVEGLPITDYCDKHKLALPERLGLLEQVCAAVQHAHQKGIVHRDLKPGNVFVAREGDKAVAKVLDFGLAKAINRDFLKATLVTERECVMGTPEYMAPEQAAGDGEVIDVRADVYSLGVILYELLTGTLPFSTNELRRAGMLEAFRIIREVDPPKPSTKFTTSHELATDVAQRRQISISRLTKELRGDLDWIVLKALAKDPERRYDAAASFAADLKRYLAHEPVLAGPPSAAYRLKKLGRRYRGQLLAALLILVTLAAAAIAAAARYAAERHRLAHELAAQRAEEGRVLATLDHGNDASVEVAQAAVDRLTARVLSGQATVTDCQRLASAFLDARWVGGRLQTLEGGPSLTFSGRTELKCPALAIVYRSIVTANGTAIPASHVGLLKLGHSGGIVGSMYWSPFYRTTPVEMRGILECRFIRSREGMRSAQFGTSAQVHSEFPSVGPEFLLPLPAYRGFALQELPEDYPVAIRDKALSSRFANSVKFACLRSTEPDQLTLSVTMSGQMFGLPLEVTVEDDRSEPAWRASSRGMLLGESVSGFDGCGFRDGEAFAMVALPTEAETLSNSIRVAVRLRSLREAARKRGLSEYLDVDVRKTLSLPIR